jgi:hypothetical protein
MASTSMSVRDAGGNLVSVAQEQTGDVRTPRSVPEVGGAAVSGSNPLPVTGVLTDTQLRAAPLPVRSAGSTGTSFAENLPAVGTLGTLLLTIPANAARAFAFVENQSAGNLTLVGDKGDDTQVWHRKLTGVGANAQGADWSSAVFFGRIRVYGAAGAQVSAGEF